MTEPRNAGPSPVHERLRRLLFLVPFVSRNPGITVEELSRALSMKKEDLLEDLDLLTMVGRPPFQPDDYIDIYVDGDRVYVDLDQRLSAPPRFTAAEATALAAAAELIRPAAGDALSTALAKLEKVLPSGAQRRFREMERKIDAQHEAPPDLGNLTRAILEHKEVEFDYFSPARKQTERRGARPLELFSHRGQWYLNAYCLRSNDRRLFRVDRMQHLEVTDRPFSAEPTPTRGSVPNPVRPTGEVKVRFSKVAAPYVLERFGTSARRLPDDGLEVFVSADQAWVTQWVLSFGGEAEVLEPPAFREAVAQAARALLSDAPSETTVLPPRADAAGGRQETGE